MPKVQLLEMSSQFEKGEDETNISILKHKFEMAELKIDQLQQEIKDARERVDYELYQQQQEHETVIELKDSIIKDCVSVLLITDDSLLIASSKGHTRVVDLLLKKGVNVNIQERAQVIKYFIRCSVCFWLFTH